MFFEAERRQPRTNCASFARTCGVAAFGRAAAGRAQRPDGGGLCLAPQAFIGNGRFRQTLQTEHRGYCRGRSLSDAGSILRIVTRVR